MNSIVIAAGPSAYLRGRILVVEPDTARAAALREAFRDYGGIEIEIVYRAAHAVRSLGERIPDVVLTSALLPPADAASLTTRLKDLPAAAHVQIITIPYFIDSAEDERTSDGRVLNFLRRRSALAQPKCPLRTLRAQIEEYISQARAMRRELDRRASLPRIVPQPPPEQPSPERMWLAPVTDQRVVATRAPLPSGPRPVPTGVVLPPDRRRGRRRAAGDVPWLWSVKLTGASHVSMIDISSSGILIETTSRIGDGMAVDLQLVGQDTNVLVPARMVRSQIASVDSLGVRYRLAIAFARELDLLGLQGTSRSCPSPKVLGDVLARVLGELDRGTRADVVRTRFEQELRRLLRVRDLQIRQTPAIAELRAESIYFTIPYGSDDQPILQAIFEPDYAPTAEEFQLLKASATLAAVVLEFAQR